MIRLIIGIEMDGDIFCDVFRILRDNVDLIKIVFEF